MTMTSPVSEDPKGKSVDLSGIHVLVVEDMDDARDALRMIFQFYGAKVRAAIGVALARAVTGLLGARGLPQPAVAGATRRFT